ncbi:MAG TPA: hypothetical protein VG457_17910 [Planctomycetota bacterium]|jgi:hypothetical protein|nr:hypothetical protein [Planctomycetota bacterium]
MPMPRILAVLSLTLLVQEAPAPLQTAWGRIEWKGDSALLYIETWPAEGKVAMPRLNNPIGTVYLVNDPSRTPLGFQPNPDNWMISRPKSSTGGPDVVVVEVQGKPRPAGTPVVSEASEDGRILLPAHHAITHGRLLRYEPQPHKNTVGYWADESDWVEWRFRVAKPGSFSVLLLQGCGKGQGGSTVKFLAAGQTFEYTVEDTGHFQNFVEKPVGTIAIEKAGDYALEIRAVKKIKGAVMDVRQVRLTPAP